MRQKPQTRQTAADKTIKDIRRATRKQYSAEEKVRIVLDGLRGDLYHFAMTEDENTAPVEAPAWKTPARSGPQVAWTFLQR